jgi:hypothetical protein
MSEKNNLDIFLSAIHGCNKILVRFYSKEDNRIIQRTCAPLDYGPSKRAKQKNNRFHIWDFDSDTGSHVLSLNPEQIISVEIHPTTFNPQELVTWDTKKSRWYIQRNWGRYS